MKPETAAPFSDGASVQLPVVGIGASAGGLAALESFFSGLPAGSPNGIAFVVVQHLAPDHTSILAELVGRFTAMPVVEVSDGMSVKADCVYIIPPNRQMGLAGGTLRLEEPTEPRGHRFPIDFLFRSLANDQGERAICVVLSGSGSDGTLGVEAVKAEGGMAMAQLPETAEYANMPRSAIQTGLVDYVLPAAQLGPTLLAYVAYAFGAGARPISTQTPSAEDTLQEVFLLLAARTGHDFSSYKTSTVVRRIERRRAVNYRGSLSDYLRLLRENPAEVDELFRDLLIGVTSFFRDPDAFAALEQDVIPKLIAAHAQRGGVRIWVPGCSTGEEAYSIAILLEERTEALKQSARIQIFATDLDPAAIRRARAGVFPASIAADIAPQRLARYFSLEQNGSAYRVNRRIRDMLIFSEQDLIKDPPFSRLDLISCRNLLIYFSAELQKRIIPMFHYALRPGGYLFLGSSEGLGDSASLFAPLDRKWKLFLKKEDLPGLYRSNPRAWRPRETAPELAASAASMKEPGRQRGSQHLVESALAQEFAPAGALVTAQGDILYCHGRTGQYLEPAHGEATMNILRMARDGLRRDLTVALQSAAAGKERVQRAGIRVKTNGDSERVTVTVIPLPAEPGATCAESTLFLVTFEAEYGPQPQAPPVSTPGEAETDISTLRRELQAKEEYLQAANEELETANEELKSSNEEMQSVNEELQSSNEELETSKEELQSINEELSTVNAELQSKVAALSRTNNDMNNLLAGTGIGTIFVDLHLRIMRYTPAITQVLNLIPTDVGRPVGDIVANLVGYDQLIVDLQKTLDTLIPCEIEVQTKAAQCYSLRIRPYRTLENAIEGAVITFVDVTEMKRAQESWRESDAKYRALFESMPQGVLFYDDAGRLVDANPAAQAILGATLASLRQNAAPQQAIRRDGTPFPWQESPAMVALRTGQRVEGVEMGVPLGGGARTIWLRVDALPLFKTEAGPPFQVYTTLTKVEEP